MNEQPAHPFIDQLTERELDILRLLADGLSNQEIAEALVFEVSTVKWYTHQIYGKLQVKNRGQAVIRARTLSLLETNVANPLQRLQHNLPADMLPFIGRKREIIDLITRLTSEKFRLITILGPGGMGKTRLAVEVGRHLLGYFVDGVYFVSLAAVTSAEQIVTTIAETIGFKFYSDTQPKQQLFGYLQKLRLLLVIDNFEHLLASAALLTDILKAAPDVKVLATSREKLNLSGELAVVIGGLSTPIDKTAPMSADHDAVKLFMEAASRTASPIDARELNRVEHICQLLGGMPLAILLAAAWVDTLSLAEIEAEIKTGLNILEATRRDAPQRHQSIEAVFDTSWKRLSPHEQVIFMRLSVFREGFTREAAQEISGADIHDLQRMVHTSFIQYLALGRYAIHELMRQYGEQKLKASSEFTMIRAKHAAFFAQFIAPVGEATWHRVDADLLEAVNVDFENVRASWQFHLENKDIQGLRSFLNGIWHFLDQYSRPQEGIDLFEAVLETFHDEAEDDTIFFRGQILVFLSWFYGDTGFKTKAIELLDQAINILQPFGAPDDFLRIYALRGIQMYMLNRPQECLDAFEKGYALSCEIDDQRWRPSYHHLIGHACFQLGQYREALKWLEPVSEFPSSLITKGAVHSQLGEYAGAEEALLKSLNPRRRHRYDQILCYSYLIENAVLAQATEKAWLYFQRALRYVDDTNYAWGALQIFGFALDLLIAEKQYVAAVEILSLILSHPSTIELTRAQVAGREVRLRNKLSADEFSAAWERGKQLDLGDVITEYMER